MATAKDIRIAPISAKDATALVTRVHYSHTYVRNSQLHFGAFLNGRLEGVMSFGPSLDKRKIVGLVKDTKWNGFLELNRMAFSEALPRNSESRAISVAMKLIHRHYPHIEWVVSFADGQQCGDGTIYRASGFVLTGYSSGAMWELPSELVSLNGGLPVIHRLKVQDKKSVISRYLLSKSGGRNFSMEGWVRRFGGRILPGYNFRYIYFLNPKAKDRLTVPVLPYATIDKLHARMYRGKNISAGEAGDGGDQPHSESAALIRPLHDTPEREQGVNSQEPAPAGDGCSSAVVAQEQKEKSNGRH